MKKLISIIFILTIFLGYTVPAFAVNIGTYKTETEYGLLDGFKINWKRKDKNTPFIDAREPSTKKELEKENRYYQESEYERTRYMYEGKAII